MCEAAWSASMLRMRSDSMVRYKRDEDVSSVKFSSAASVGMGRPSMSSVYSRAQHSVDEPRSRMHRRTRTRTGE
jgi:hypothetical protein